MDYRVEKLDGHTWLIEEYDAVTSVYMYLLEGTQKALLIDTGMGQIALDEIVRELTGLPVEVLNTHGHLDHIGGNGLFDRVHMSRLEQGVYGLHSSEELWNKHSAYPMPKMRDNVEWFDGEPTLDLGGRPLEIILTPGHTLGSVCVLDAERRWLFTGDTCCKASVLLMLDYCTTVEEYRQSVEKLWRRRSDYTLTWPAHHAKPVVPEILVQFQEACDQLLEQKQEGVSQTTGFGESYIYRYQDVAIEYDKARLRG